MENNETPAQLAERQPWHKPAVQRLDVGLDTQGSMNQAAKVGSGEDQLSMTTVGPN
jgi:hypothetical protein